MPHREGNGKNQVGKRKGKYKQGVKRALQRVEEQAAAAAQAEQAVQWARDREKLLIDFIICQEELERILDLQTALLAEVDASPDPQAAAQAAAGTSVAGQVHCSSWCTDMLSRITVGHVMTVKQMSMQDWCVASRQNFSQALTLLELCNRDMQLAGLSMPAAEADDDCVNAAPTTTALFTATGLTAGSTSALQATSPTAAALEDAAGDAAAAASCAAGRELSLAPSLNNFVASARGASVSASVPAPGQTSGALHPTTPGVGGDAGPAGTFASAVLCPGPDLALLQYMEQSTMLVFAAMFYNPQPYYAAAACNFSTGQLELMPQGHSMQVVQRLQLSHEQVQHLRITNTEFVRLARVTSQEGESLAEATAKLSLSGVVDAITQGAGSSQQSINPAVNTTAEVAPLAPAAEQQDSRQADMLSGRQEVPAPGSAAAAQPTQGAPQPTPASAAANTGSQTAAPAAGATSRAAAAAAAAAAGQADAELGGGETPGEALSRQLDRYVRRMHIHTLVTAMCVVNTLTPRQMAMLVVASYPYAPNVHALAEAAMTYEPPPRALKAPAASGPAGRAAAPADGDSSSGVEQCADDNQGQQLRSQVPPQHQLQQQQRWPAGCDAWAQQVQQQMVVRNEQLDRQVRQWWAAQEARV